MALCELCDRIVEPFAMCAVVADQHTIHAFNTHYFVGILIKRIASFYN